MEQEIQNSNMGIKGIAVGLFFSFLTVILSVFLTFTPLGLFLAILIDVFGGSRDLFGSRSYLGSHGWLYPLSFCILFLLFNTFLLIMVNKNRKRGVLIGYIFAVIMAVLMHILFY